MIGVSIKMLSTIEELEQMQQIETAVWRMDPIPVHQTFTALKNGGVVLGAFDDERIVGFLYSFAGFQDGFPYLCSHMMGILPTYQKHGLGAKLKLKQAEIAGEKGYRRIIWTFDPLESKNAYLNLHKLKAVGAWYKADHYGSMNDDLNQGLPTDRIQIKWDITSPHANLSVPFQKESVLLKRDQDGAPVVQEHFRTADFSNDGVYFMEIPENFQEIKQTNFSLAKAWRIETRNVFQQLFDHGFQAIDFQQDEQGNCYYIFSK